ncbi:alkaline phosphatase family protein [uncultured Desulfuromonas sp.]|uniref:alkaline phosphatase family protein n=1 Tax=uncultured Desulfuromonas sp. TaxID=181013 RepID=UPI002614EC0F|nr:alkaline phosphatase family protein [uncultured Desulfuromonas sp.]
MPDKCILILLDGLGDRAYEELGGLTPLQAAATPNLDRLAAAGGNGLYHAAALGQALPSENAHFAMFGFSPEEFPGRGALEALGGGVDLQPGEVALLVHLVGVHEESGTLILDRDLPEASAGEAEALIAAVATYETGGVRIRFHRTKGLFGVLTLSGEVAPYVTDTNLMMERVPLPEVLPWQTHREDPAARNTARALKEYLVWAHRRLQAHPVNAERAAQGRHPVNGLVTQRAGRLKNVPSFAERNGLRGLSLSSGIVYWGISRFLGLDLVQAKDSAAPGADLAARLELAREKLPDYDFVHVHTKAADEAAHRKDPAAKKAVIEAFDEGIGRVLPDLLADPDLLLIVTADHSTPSGGPLIHSGEPVPLLLHGRGVRRDAVERYDEVAAAAGAVGCVRGREFMYLVLNHLERAKLAGIMDTPIDQPYWPGDFQPFRLEEPGQ